MYIYREDEMEYFHNDEDTDDEDPFVGKSEYVLSEDWDFVVDRKRRHGDLKATTYFKCKPHENKAFDLNTAMGKIALLPRENRQQSDALVNKSRPVHFRVHIGEYCFVSMKDGWDYVQIFECLPEPLKIFAKDMCPACSYDLYHEGISISFNDWRRPLEFIPTIHEEYPLVGAAPAYLADDCQLLSDIGRRPLRSNSNDMQKLVVPRTHNKLGDRSFAAAGPRLWNDLPLGLRRPGLSSH